MLNHDSFWNKFDYNFITSIDELNVVSIHSDKLFKHLVDAALLKTLENYTRLEYNEIINLATKINNGYPIGEHRVLWIKNLYKSYKTQAYYNILSLAC